MTMPDAGFDPTGWTGFTLNSRWRFVLLIALFNILLVGIVLISLHNQEIWREIRALEQINRQYRDILSTRGAEVVRIVYITATPTRASPMPSATSTPPQATGDGATGGGATGGPQAAATATSAALATTTGTAPATATGTALPTTTSTPQATATTTPAATATSTAPAVIPTATELLPTSVPPTATPTATPIATATTTPTPTATPTATSLPPPMVWSITPPLGFDNQAALIASVTGANFQTGATVDLTRAGQPNVSGTSVVVAGSSWITCTFDLRGVVTGTWNVVVTNPDLQTGSLANGFTVSYPPVTVVSISPTSGLNNSPVNVTDLAGTGFRPGADVRLLKSGQPDVVATAVNVVGATRIACTLDISGTAPGAWDVRVTNTDSQSGTLASGFTVIDAQPYARAIFTSACVISPTNALGAPDGSQVRVNVQGVCTPSVLILDMGLGNGIADDAGLDFYYYEWWTTWGAGNPGILMDRVQVDVAPDNGGVPGPWRDGVLIWGDAITTNNGTIPVTYTLSGEVTNTQILAGDLHPGFDANGNFIIDSGDGSGIGVDIGLNDSTVYRFIRIRRYPPGAPGVPGDEAAEVDAIERIH